MTGGEELGVRLPVAAERELEGCPLASIGIARSIVGTYCASSATDSPVRAVMNGSHIQSCGAAHIRRPMPSRYRRTRAMYSAGVTVHRPKY